MTETAPVQAGAWNVQARAITDEAGNPDGYAITAATHITAREAAALVLEQGGAIKMADSLFVRAHPNETAGELTSEILAQTIAAKLPKVRRQLEQIAEHEVTAWSDSD